MKIVEILAKSAMLLGLNEEANILTTSQPKEDETENEENQNLTESEILKNEKIKSLFNLSRYALQELCTNYVPVIERIYINSADCKIKVSDLPNYIRVQNIMKDEISVRYKIIKRCIYLEQDGQYCIEYLTYPNVESIFDELDFLSNLSEDVIVCSICAYFSLAHGMFEEFKEFHELYLNKAENIKDLKSFNLPKRRWE